MAVVNPAFLDTSVLLGGLIEFGPSAEPAQRIFSAIADGHLSPVSTAWHCCLEFYAVSTRLPEELRLTPQDASLLVREEILARFRVHQMPEEDRERFFRELSDDRVVGGRLYDSHIAEIARSSDARVVVTENRRHFSSLLKYGIQVLTAAEFAETQGLRPH